MRIKREDVDNRKVDFSSPAVGYRPCTLAKPFATSS